MVVCGTALRSVNGDGNTSQNNLSFWKASEACNKTFYYIINAGVGEINFDIIWDAENSMKGSRNQVC